MPFNTKTWSKKSTILATNTKKASEYDSVIFIHQIAIT